MPPAVPAERQPGRPPFIAHAGLLLQQVLIASGQLRARPADSALLLHPDIATAHMVLVQHLGGVGRRWRPDEDRSLHSVRVALRALSWLPEATPIAIRRHVALVALLHDLLEDSPVYYRPDAPATENQRRRDQGWHALAQQFGLEVANDVLHLSDPVGATGADKHASQQHRARHILSGVATLVKLADKTDNLASDYDDALPAHGRMTDPAIDWQRLATKPLRKWQVVANMVMPRDFYLAEAMRRGLNDFVSIWTAASQVIAARAGQTNIPQAPLSPYLLQCRLAHNALYRLPTRAAGSDPAPAP